MKHRVANGIGSNGKAMLAIDDRSAALFDRADKPSRLATARWLNVEQVASRDIVDFRAAWADLAARTLEANIFLDPAFALPLVQHVAPERRPDFLLVWEASGPELHERLIGLCPVSVPRWSILGRARGFTDKQVSLGTPLLDRDRGQAAFEVMLEWLAQGPRPGGQSRDPLRGLLRPRALILNAIPADGLFMRTIVAALVPARHEVLASSNRAALRPSGSNAANVLSLRSAKTRKERKRQRRRLAERGARAYSSARTPAEIAAATERFLLLETKGWKGVRGTALLTDAALATFVRAMTRAMSLEGKCRIDALEIDGRAIAMGIVLTAGSSAHFWKTTFDEDLARLSPGVQFAADLAEMQFGETGVTMTDSCAIQNHPMIDRLWPDRLEVIDLAISLQGGGVLFGLSLELERALRAARALAKTTWLSLKKLRRTR